MKSSTFYTFPKRLALFSSVLVLSACSSTSGLDLIKFEETRDYKDMYLRGTVSWWEATEQFKFQKLNANIYQLTIELIADGQPYDFKIADASWTPELTCGFEYESQIIDLYEEIELACEETSQNVKFVPAETGLFTFTFDVSDNSEPELVIKSAN